MLTNQKFKGVVLAAGLGTRLSPLTRLWPKPLVPFLGTTPLELALWRLKQANVTTVAINSHHLPSQLIQAASNNLFDQSIHVSHEPTLLGTGGVYAPLRKWRDGSSLVILNGDVVSNIDLSQLIYQHVATNAVATMVLLPEVIPGESAVWYEGDRVQAIGRQPLPKFKSGNFACAQVLSPEFLDLLPDSGVFDIISTGYRVALEKNLRVGCLLHHGVWHDLRTPQYYWDAIKDSLKNLAEVPSDTLGIRYARLKRHLSTEISKDFVLSDSLGSNQSQLCQIGPWTMIEKDVVIEGHCQVHDAILLPGAKVTAGSVVSKRILGPGIDLPLSG